VYTPTNRYIAPSKTQILANIIDYIGCGVTDIPG
jgi:hypothetical protein